MFFWRSQGLRGASVFKIRGSECVSVLLYSIDNGARETLCYPLLQIDEVGVRNAAVPGQWQRGSRQALAQAGSTCMFAFGFKGTYWSKRVDNRLCLLHRLQLQFLAWPNLSVYVDTSRGQTISFRFHRVRRGTAAFIDHRSTSNVQGCVSQPTHASLSLDCIQLAH